MPPTADPIVPASSGPIVPLACFNPTASAVPFMALAAVVVDQVFSMTSDGALPHYRITLVNHQTLPYAVPLEVWQFECIDDATEFYYAGSFTPSPGAARPSPLPVTNVYTGGSAAADGNTPASGGNLSPATPGRNQATSGGNLAPPSPGQSQAGGSGNLNPTAPGQSQAAGGGNLAPGSPETLQANAAGDRAPTAPGQSQAAGSGNLAPAAPGQSQPSGAGNLNPSAPSKLIP